MTGLYENRFLRISRAAASVPGAGGDAVSQDCCGNQQNQHGHFLVVADGHDRGGVGGVASRLVVETILEFYRNWNGQGPRKMLVDAVGLANAALRQAVLDDKRLNGAHVSVALLHHQEGAVRIAHVGNCRAYRQRNYVIDQLTEDHLTPAPAGGPAGAKFVLARAVGMYPIVEVDVSDAHFVQAGETFILCTDGVSSRLSDVEIGRRVMAGPPQAACDGLMELVKNGSGPESASLAIIKFSEPAEQGQRLSAAAAPAPTLILAAGRPVSWGHLSPGWKFRLFALGVLLLWFLTLLVLWGVFGWGSPSAGLHSAAVRSEQWTVSSEQWRTSSVQFAANTDHRPLTTDRSSERPGARR
jgi:protein phosphatase